MDEKYLDDDTQLAQMGHKAELKRHFSLLYVYRLWLRWSLTAGLIIFDVFSRSMLGLAFAILNVCIRLILFCENEEMTTNAIR